MRLLEFLEYYGQTREHDPLLACNLSIVSARPYEKLLVLKVHAETVRQMVRSVYWL